MPCAMAMVGANFIVRVTTGGVQGMKRRAPRNVLGFEQSPDSNMQVPLQNDAFIDREMTSDGVSQ